MDQVLIIVYLIIYVDVQLCHHLDNTLYLMSFVYDLYRFDKQGNEDNGAAGFTKSHVYKEELTQH